MKYFNSVKNLILFNRIESIIKKSKKNLVFICMGNKKVNFDCYASFVADKLKELNAPIYVYGGEKYPLYGDTLIDMKKFLEKTHKNDTIIFIDVAKTRDKSLNGEVIVSKNKFQVANSKVVFDYDFSFCYMVNLESNENHYNLQKRAAEKVAYYIANCYQVF